MTRPRDGSYAPKADRRDAGQGPGHDLWVTRCAPPLPATTSAVQLHRGCAEPERLSAAKPRHARGSHHAVRNLLRLAGRPRYQRAIPQRRWATIAPPSHRPSSLCRAEATKGRAAPSRRWIGKIGGPTPLASSALPAWRSLRVDVERIYRLARRHE